MRKIFAYLFIVVFMALAPQAHAQSTSIGVVDIEAVLQKSAAGKHIRSQLDQKRTQYQKQIAAKEEGLRAAEKSILSEKSTMSEAEFNEKRKSFERDVLSAQKMVRDNKSSLEAGLTRAWAKLRGEIRTTIEGIAQQRGYAMVISKDAVIIAADALDITQEVVVALDKRISKLDIDWSAQAE